MSHCDKGKWECRGGPGECINSQVMMMMMMMTMMIMITMMIK